MKTRNVIRVFSLGLMTSLALASCDNSASKMDEKGGGAAGDSTEVGLKVAYVEVDSLISQYEFCKEYTLILQKKSTNARNTLTQKGKQLQNAVTNFQQKINNNGFTSREEAANVQAAIQRQEQSLQELQARLAAELDSETIKYNAALRDSLQNFLKDYNAQKKYDFILSKANDNILHANAKYDITQDVINGLNKRYQPIEKKDDKKK